MWPLVDINDNGIPTNNLTSFISIFLPLHTTNTSSQQAKNSFLAQKK
jgi:hypothetical protein